MPHHLHAHFSSNSTLISRSSISHVVLHLLHLVNLYYPCVCGQSQFPDCVQDEDIAATDAEIIKFCVCFRRLELPNYWTYWTTCASTDLRCPSAAFCAHHNHDVNIVAPHVYQSEQQWRKGEILTTNFLLLSAHVVIRHSPQL